MKKHTNCSFRNQDGRKALLHSFFLISTFGWFLPNSTTAFQPLSSFLPSSSFLININQEDSTREFFEQSIAKLQALDMNDYIRSAMSQTTQDEKWSQILANQLLPSVDDIQSIWQSSFSTISPTMLSIPFLVGFAIFLLRLPYPNDDYRKGYEPYQRGNYNPLVARAYYSRYPLLVAQRTAQLLRYSYRFLFNIFVDKYIRRKEELFYKQRAAELLELINKAGPTAIKVGQALSVRPDLIPTEYAEALSTLQDRVPPFPSYQARELLLAELGESGMDKLKDIRMEEPVAAASIGQVYRGKYKSSMDNVEREIAIKVQRPNVLSEIALDLHIVREFAPLYQRLTGAATDFSSLANEWGRGFLAELDYTAEAYNTQQFNIEMKKRGLDNVVTAPTVVEELSTTRILTTEWVSGVRLDQSKAGDIPTLCTVALNAYLVMLLETGCLHCDPHPGNLLRRDDGKLCILDFGMTLPVESSLQYSLLEFVAHLTAEEYDQLPTDLVQLGFLKAERVETVRASGFLEPLSLLLQQAGKGGGGKKVRERIFTEYREKFPGVEDDELRTLMRQDMKERMEEARKRESAVSGITLEVEELQKRNRDAFKIPDWFLYTSRAFLTLEGICLQADENYSIIKSCYPYVAKRLLKDDSPRAQAALKELLYGAGDRLSAKRLTDLADGITSYVSSTKGAVTIASNGDLKANFADAEKSVELVKIGADLILAPNGNVIQNILIDEGVSAINAQLKDSLRLALLDTPTRFRSSLPLNLGNFLPKPLENEFSPFLKKTDEEVRSQKLLSQVVGLLNTEVNTAQPTGSSPANLNAEQIALILKTVRENSPKYLPLIAGFGGKFSSTLLRKLSDDIERALEEGHDGSSSERIVRDVAKRIASAAKQGVEAIKS